MSLTKQKINKQPKTKELEPNCICKTILFNSLIDLVFVEEIETIEMCLVAVFSTFFLSPKEGNVQKVL